jgi:hypothetical protein
LTHGEVIKSAKALAKRMKKILKNSWPIHGHSCERKTYNSHVMGHEYIFVPFRGFKFEEFRSLGV